MKFLAASLLLITSERVYASVERQILDSVQLYRLVPFKLDPYPAMRLSLKVEAQLSNSSDTSYRILLKVIRKSRLKQEMLLAQEIPANLFANYYIPKLLPDTIPNDLSTALGFNKSMNMESLLGIVTEKQQPAVHMCIYHWNYLLFYKKNCSRRLVACIRDAPKQPNSNIIEDNLHFATTVLAYNFNTYFAHYLDVMVFLHLLEYIRHLAELVGSERMHQNSEEYWKIMVQKLLDRQVKKL